MQVREQKIVLEHKRASIHGFSPYLATFPDEVPKYVIDRFLPPATYSKNCGLKKLILDPFCGSGTTLLVAAENNTKAIGVDVNPMAVMISNAKCSVFNDCEDFRDANKLLEKIGALKPFSNDGNIGLSVNADRVKYWFHSKVAEDLFLLRDTINGCGNEKVRNLALVVYAVTLRVCSYARNDTISRARKTYSIIEASKANAFRDFSRRFEDALELKKCQNLLVGDNMAIAGDSRSLFFDDGLFDGIVTSPPYVANINYSTPFDLFYVFMGWKIDKKSFINGQDREKFFDGMRPAYKEMYRVLKPDSPCVMIVGERETKGTIEYMTKAGFELEEKLFYDVKGRSRGFFHGKKRLREYVLVFWKP
jgi:SAM-dependent methyltransferase